MRYAGSIGCCLLLLMAPVLARAALPDEPVILSPEAGATVGSPVTIVVSSGVKGVVPGDAGGGMDRAMGGAAMGAMPGMPHGAHLHLLIDVPLPAAGTAIPMDARHIHLMHGETRTTIRLPAGTHTIQLIMGSVSHVVAADAPRSAPVTFRVK